MAHSQEHEQLFDRIRGCLVGVALGDALGMPWETKTHEQILELTDGKGVTGLQDLPEMRDLPPDPRGLKLGDTTDDWQLTKAVATSLIRRKGFDIYDQAAAHCEAFMASTAGWGGTTKRAVAELKQWFRSYGREGRNPSDPAPEYGEGMGHGNGVLMKIAPIACARALVWTCCLGKDMRENLQHGVLCLNGMTHRSSGQDAIQHIAASVENSMRIMLQHKSLDPYETYRICRREAFEVYTSLDDLFLKMHRPYLLDHGLNAEFASPTSATLRQALGTSSLAKESGIFSLGTFHRNPTDFRATVLEAINAGGDTDTNASIVGALTGANVGLKGIPNEWIEQVPSAREAIDVANQLIETFSIKES